MVLVTDSKGRLITNLTRDDFRIYEDDKPQTIRNYVKETDLPLSIALLVDSSGSVIEQIKFEQAAAIDFFFNTMKRKKDRGTVIGFDSVARILSNDTSDGFTDEPERLAEAVRKNSRRLRIEQLILLLVRIAILMLLVLGLAQPQLQSFGRLFAANVPTHRIIVLDTSFSMVHQDDFPAV